MSERIRNTSLEARITTPEEAARLVKDGMTVGMSGFTAVGYPKAFPTALAQSEAKPKITLITGASVGDELDGNLSRAGIIDRRYPYQTNKSIRDLINRNEVKYVDMHLSHVPLWIKNNWFGKIDLAVIEAAAVNADGSIVPTTSVGCADALIKAAEKVVVEINTCIPAGIEDLFDIYTPEKVPFTKPIPIEKPGDRIGTKAIPCDPEKIAAIIFCDIPDGNSELKEADDTMKAIASNLIAFLQAEVKADRLANPLPPLQSGVGGVANAVLSCLAESDFEDLTVSTEVMQDAVVKLLDSGKVKVASATALTISPSKKDAFFENIGNYAGKIILRPEEISNSPEVIRRLGVIAMNTALEADLGGNVNSTHVSGTRVMNGIGGSGDFARNAGLTIFTTASTAKNGTLSCIVPQVTHIDHTEHDVDVIITEQGAADIRGLTPYEKARVIIDNCAHPDFKPALNEYLEKAIEKNLGHGLPSPAQL